MSVVILILKIIGILILSILGLLLIGVALVLLVPVQYRIRGETPGVPEVTLQIRVTWLLHLVAFRVGYQDGKLTQGFYLFGIPFRMGKKKPKKSKKKSKRSRKMEDQGIHEGDNPEDFDLEEDFSDENIWEPLEPPENRQGDQHSEAVSLKPRPLNKEDSAPPGKHPKKKRINLDRIRNFPGMIRQKWEKLKSILATVWRELHDEVNHSAIAVLLREIMCILNHGRPRKVKADLAFSTGDPALTGQALGAISVLPWLYQYSINLDPDFLAEQFYLKGNFLIQGHIRGVHALLMAIRLFRDENIRSLLHRYRNS